MLRIRPLLLSKNRPVISKKYGLTFPKKSWKWLVSRGQAENVFISGSSLHY